MIYLLQYGVLLPVLRVLRSSALFCVLRSAQSCVRRVALRRVASRRARSNNYNTTYLLLVPAALGIFQRGDEQRTGFFTLKEKLITEPILVVLDLYKSFEVHCDACGNCIGAALHQDGHVVAYESRRLQDAEKHMGIYEKGLLAVIHVLSTWKPS